MEPPTPRSSLLGLDRLAREKREAMASDPRGSRKKPPIDGEEPVFKGDYLFYFYVGVIIMPCIVPALPASRLNNMRQRGNETPSHPGGLSDAARKKLEDHRKNRDKQRGMYTPIMVFISLKSL